MTMGEMDKRRQNVWHTSFGWTDANYELYSAVRDVCHPRYPVPNNPVETATLLQCRLLFQLENTVIPIADWVMP